MSSPPLPWSAWPLVTTRATLREELGGFRFYLDDQPIHAGDVIEIHTGGGWRLVRFEWNGRRDTNVDLYRGPGGPAFWFHPRMFERVPLRWGEGGS